MSFVTVEEKPIVKHIRTGDMKPNSWGVLADYEGRYLVYRALENKYFQVATESGSISAFFEGDPELKIEKILENTTITFHI